MSNARNNLVRQLSHRSLFESALPVLSTLSTWNDGDILFFDATNKIINAITGDGCIANLVGVAQQSVKNGIVPSPYQGTAVDASVGFSDMEGPAYGDIFSMVLKSGDSFTPGIPVYATTDPQTVTVTNPGSGNNVGIFQGPAVTPSVTGTFGDVLIGARYNMTGIHF